MTTFTKFYRAFAVASGLLLTSAVVPAVAQTRVEQGTTNDRDHRGFNNWGLLGLVGLAGLLSRKRDRTVVEPRRI